jgi:hypothetical protein
VNAALLSSNVSPTLHKNSKPLSSIFFRSTIDLIHAAEGEKLLHPQMLPAINRVALDLSAGLCENKRDECVSAITAAKTVPSNRQSSLSHACDYNRSQGTKSGTSPILPDFPAIDREQWVL